MMEKNGIPRDTDQRTIFMPVSCPSKALLEK